MNRPGTQSENQNHPYKRAVDMLREYISDPEEILVIEFDSMSEYIGQTVTLIAAAPIESYYPHSALVLIAPPTVTGIYYEKTVRVRGNAGRIALHLERSGMLPCKRVARSVKVNGHDLYFWEEEGEGV